MRVGLGSGKGIKHSEEEGRGEERKPLSIVGYPMPVKFMEVQRLGSNSKFSSLEMLRNARHSSSIKAGRELICGGCRKGFLSC